MSLFFNGTSDKTNESNFEKVSSAQNETILIGPQAYEDQKKFCFFICFMFASVRSFVSRFFYLIIINSTFDYLFYESIYEALFAPMCDFINEFGFEQFRHILTSLFSLKSFN